MEQPKHFFYAGNRTGGALGDGRDGEAAGGSAKMCGRHHDPICRDGTGGAFPRRLFYVGDINDRGILCMQV